MILGTGLSRINFQTTKALNSKYDSLDDLKSNSVIPEGWEFLPGNSTTPLQLGANLSAEIQGALIDTGFISEVRTRVRRLSACASIAPRAVF